MTKALIFGFADSRFSVGRMQPKCLRRALHERARCSQHFE